MDGNIGQVGSFLRVLIKIGRIKIGRLKIGRLKIGRLKIGRLKIGLTECGLLSRIMEQVLIYLVI